MRFQVFTFHLSFWSDRISELIPCSKLCQGNLPNRVVWSLQDFLKFIFEGSAPDPMSTALFRGRAKGDGAQSAVFLRFSAKIFGFSAVSCALQMLEFPGEGVNLRKISGFLRKSSFLGALCHLSFRHLKRVPASMASHATEIVRHARLAQKLLEDRNSSTTTAGAPKFGRSREGYGSEDFSLLVAFFTRYFFRGFFRRDPACATGVKPPLRQDYPRALAGPTYAATPGVGTSSEGGRSALIRALALGGTEDPA